MDANTAALNLIQKWVGSDDKITDMSAFYDALVKALEEAHSEGEEEFSCREHRRNRANTFARCFRPEQPIADIRRTHPCRTDGSV